MAKKEIEGDGVLGWPDRQRPTHKQSKDAEGRVIGAGRRSWIRKG